MFLETIPVRRGRLLSIGASAAMLAVAVGAAPATAAPTVQAEVVEGTLLVTGSPAPDKITLRLNAANTNQLQVDVGDDGSADFAFDQTTFRAITVRGGNGDDTIRMNETNGVFTTVHPTTLDGGNGDDTLLGGAGVETLNGGLGDDSIDGNGGVDHFFGGNGDDTLIWDPGDGSDILEGGPGFDTMVFNGNGGNEIMAATAVGSRVHFTRNLGGIVMDLNEVEAIVVNALGGTDSVTVNDMTGTDVELVDVDLAATLGGSTSDNAADTVTVVGTTGDDSISAVRSGGVAEVHGLAALVRISHVDSALDSLVIDTRAGADDVNVDPALPALISVSVL
jgi:hypothetical protein